MCVFAFKHFEVQALYLAYFSDHCVKEVKANRANIAQHLSSSLMLVTALNPFIGYDNGAFVIIKSINSLFVLLMMDGLID